MIEDIKNNSEVVIITISFIGLILSILSVVISRLAYKFSVDQSKPKGRLYVGLDWKSTDKTDKNTYINVIIYNTGLRDLHFAWPCVGMQYLIKKPQGVLYLKSSFSTHEAQFMLKGGQSKSILFQNDYTKKELININYFYIQDQIGNTYKFQVAKWYRRLRTKAIKLFTKLLNKFKHEKSSNTR